jgi:BRCT domain type II-containing protein
MESSPTLLISRSSWGRRLSTNPKIFAVDDNEDEDKVQVVGTDTEMLHSPKKVTCTATTHSGIPKEMTEEQKFTIKSMVDEWMADHIDEPPPPQLAALAARAGLMLEKVASTPSQRGKKDKVKVDTPATSEGTIANSLKGLRFVLLGTWPDLGGGRGLTSGKLCLKSRIEKLAGSVTAMSSCLTDFLVVGTSPGPKKGHRSA